MVTRALPRLVIAAPSSGSGKTTVTTGLMAALARRGQAVSPHKVGPDFIDPGFHALACGRPGRNLDPFLCGADLMAPLLLHGAADGGSGAPATVALIEGVMGLFDGQLGRRGFASTAHVAALTRTPVLLVVDASHGSRTWAAVVAGLAAFDPAVRVAGVVLNKVGSPRHEAELRQSLGDIGIPVLGCLRRDPDIRHPEMHLGLVPAEESDVAGQLVAALADRVAACVDLDAVLALAAEAPPLDAAPWDPAGVVAPPSGARPVVAVAGGRAFTFRYAETLELLRAAGTAPVVFDPLRDAALPAGTAGLYFGGGFPETHAAALGDNRALALAIRDAVTGGVPTVAECGGLLYLGTALDGTPMSGPLPHAAAMNPRLALGYRNAVAPANTLLARAGDRVRGHEFHRTRLDRTYDSPAWAWDGASGPVTDGVSAAFGGRGPSLHASYLHCHWAGSPQLAQRFADAVHTYADRAAAGGASAGDGGAPRPTSRAAEPTASVGTFPVGSGSPSERSVPALAPAPDRTAPAAHDLDHHGDRDAVAGAADFAVNVHHAGPPDWLAEALRAVDVTAYPDAAPARAALADRHGLPEAAVLPTAGAAEAFTLLARLWSERRWCVVHPQFTEPEAALHRTGARVERFVLTPPFRLDPDALLAFARERGCDVVMIGNPTNPTGVLHPVAALRRLLDAGLTVVVDEAFLPAWSDASLLGAAGARERLVVVRSATKIWAIPGVRAGWIAAPPAEVARLAALQTPWSVSAHALAALTAVSAPRAEDEERHRVAELAAARDDLAAQLRRIGLAPVAGAAPFVLADTGVSAGLRPALAERGYAVRRGESFPGLDARWLRLAARTPELHARLADALAALLPSTEGNA